MRDAFDHCAQLVRASDKDRFLATLFAPMEHRPALHALYAFDLEISAIGGRVRDPFAGEVRLQWWREVIDGRRADEAAANPVAACLLATIADGRLAREPLLDVVEAHVFDIYREPMHTMAALENYACRTAGAVVKLAASILKRAGGAVDNDLIEHAGIAQTITHVLRHLPLHASRRQLFVPAEVLARHGADAREILAGRTSPNLAAALAELRARAREQLRHASRLIGREAAVARAAFLPLAVVPLYLDRVERSDFNPFKTAIEVPQWQRQWALWRMARRLSR